MGVTMHQPRSRISAAFCVQPIYTQLLVLVYIDRATVGTGYSRSSCLFRSHCQHNCCPLYSKCEHSDCPSWLSSISVIIQAHLRASCLRLCSCAGCQVVRKSYHYSIQEHTERLMPDLYEKSQFNSLVCHMINLWSKPCGTFVLIRMLNTIFASHFKSVILIGSHFLVQWSTSFWNWEHCGARVGIVKVRFTSGQLSGHSVSHNTEAVVYMLLMSANGNCQGNCHNCMVGYQTMEIFVLPKQLCNCQHLYTYTIGIHASYSNVVANTTALSCTIDVHTPPLPVFCLSWLSSITAIFQAHLWVSCLRLCSCAGCQIVENLTVTLNSSVQEHMEWRMPDLQFNSLVWGSLTLGPISAAASA